MLDPLEELDELADKNEEPIARAVMALARAHVQGGTPARERAFHDLAAQLGSTMGIADMLGRRRLLLELRETEQPARMAVQVSPLVPPNEFREAMADIVKREPTLARNAEQVAQVYMSRHGFSAARAVNTEVLKRVQKAMTDLMAVGMKTPDAAAVLADMTGWTKAYSETVYRTNLSTAYHAGRFQQVYDPDVRDLVSGFAFSATLDSNVRPNHRAAHYDGSSGIIATTDDPIWDHFTPPLGYNCRCSLRILTRAQTREKFGKGPIPPATVPPGAHADPNFGGGRPDRGIYARAAARGRHRRR